MQTPLTSNLQQEQSTKPKLVMRSVNQSALNDLLDAGVSPVLARVLAARGITQSSQLEVSLAGLIPPERLSNNAQMAKHLADAIQQHQSILVVGDYDADGATATAVAVRGLRAMGAKVSFLVPNRFEYGYGLTPEIVMLAHQAKPDLIITVDNGIASVDGVAKANELGIKVLITDHHLPSEQTPQALCIINPNQRDCDFPSKHLAGVGVMFYALLALRAELRLRAYFTQIKEPNLTELLDIVALGTVADLVKLDDNNRILVEQGLRRIRAGKACPAINVLLKLAGRDVSRVTAQDLGFSVGPRLNAAGRLDDMSLGIRCLISDDVTQTQSIAEQLHTLNLARRSIEADMQEAATISLEEMDVKERYSLSLYQEDWHQGVIGILASRIKERYHRPVIAFANVGDGMLKGSGRSISGLHLRDALDLIAKQQPELIIKFGGHAMAAGLTIKEDHFGRFNQAFEQVAKHLLSPADLDVVIENDGFLTHQEFTFELAQTLEKYVWGQGFPVPTFFNYFEVLDQRIVGERHLKLRLKKIEPQNQTRPPLILEAIFFGQQRLLPQKIGAVYQLQTNQFNGAQSIQLNLKYCETVLNEGQVTV